METEEDLGIREQEPTASHLGEAIVGSCDYNESNSTIAPVLAFTCLRCQFQRERDWLSWGNMHATP